MFITVRVKPGAREASVREEHGTIIISTPARPEGGKANKAVQQLLAEHLGIAQSDLELLRGSTSRVKIFRRT